MLAAVGAPQLAAPRIAGATVAAAPHRHLRAVAGSSPAPACTTADLDVWIDTQGSGVLGGSYYFLELTNLSNHRCTLYGYPGVSAVSLAGRQIGSPAGRDAAHAPTTITLAPAKALGSLVGATASAALKVTDVSVYPARRCAAVVAAGLRVYPPNQTASKIVPFPFSKCSRVGTVDLQIQAVAKSAPLG